MSELSGGEGRKVALVCALLGSPELVILDEPTANIDLHGRLIIEKVLHEYFEGTKRCLFFSSHQMDEVEKLADRVIVLKNGEILAQGSALEMRKKFGLKKVTFHSVANISDFKTPKRWEVVDDKFYLWGEDSDLMIKEVLNLDSNATHLNIESPHLDEILLKLWDKSCE